MFSGVDTKRNLCYYNCVDSILPFFCESLPARCVGFLTSASHLLPVGRPPFGRMAEWLIVSVLKTDDGRKVVRGFKSHSVLKALLHKVVQGYKTYRFSELAQISAVEIKASLTDINEM